MAGLAGLPPAGSEPVRADESVPEVKKTLRNMASVRGGVRWCTKKPTLPPLLSEGGDDFGVK